MKYLTAFFETISPGVVLLFSLLLVVIATYAISDLWKSRHEGQVHYATSARGKAFFRQQKNASGFGANRRNLNNTNQRRVL